MNLTSEFKAHVAGLNVTDKKMKLVLELDCEIKPQALSNITQMVGENIFVNLGSPQMAMDFDEPENEEMAFEQPEGRKYETDASGVVVKMFPLPEPAQEEQSKAEDENIIEGEFTVVSEEESQEEETESVEQTPSDEEVEEFILSGKAPSFEDIPYDFPELLHKKKAGTSWTKLAMQLDTSLGKLTRSYKDYKERVAQQISGSDVTA